MILQNGRAVLPSLMDFSTLYMAASSKDKTAFLGGSEGETSAVLYWMIDTSYFKNIHRVGSDIIQEIFEKAPLMIEIKGCNNSSHAVNLIMYTYNKNFQNNISVLFKVICYCILQGCLGRTDHLLECFSYSKGTKNLEDPNQSKPPIVESAIL